MHAFWTISTTNVMYGELQIYTSMAVGKHGLQSFEGLVDVLLLLTLSFDIFIIAYYFEHVVCPNNLKCRLQVCSPHMYDCDTLAWTCNLIPCTTCV